MIKIFATHALDILIKNNNVVSSQKGGPALFIENVLKSNSIEYINYQTNNGVVEIEIKNDDEFGKIKEIEILKKYPKISKNENILISTLLNEVDLTKILNSSNVFIDFQGFTRKINGNFGEKIVYTPPLNFYPKVVKVTKTEANYLDQKFLEDQKNRILIITNGSRDLVVFENKKEYFFKIENKLKVKNTIGAGDTFFANFFVNYAINKHSLSEAIKKSINATSDFLLLK